MKIIIATDFFAPKVDGASISCTNLARGLAARGHEVLVLAPSLDRHNHTEAQDGYAVHRLASVSLKLYPQIRLAVRPAPEIEAAIEAFQPDIVHAQNPLEISRAAILAARKRHVPVISTNHAMPENVLGAIRALKPLHSPLSRAMRSYITFIYKKTDIVTMPTQSAIDAMAGKYRSVCRVVSNGVDTERFQPGPPSIALHQHYHLPEDIPTVLYVGRLDGEKHLNVLVRALALVQRTRPAHGLFVGRGNARRDLEALAKRLGIHDRLTFAGYVADEDLPQMYHLGAVFAIPSPAELQSMVTMEAAATGLPIVAADAVALPELCQPGVNGELFKTDSPASMAKAITKVLENPRGLKAMGIASRRIALEHSFEKSLMAFEALYAEAIALHHPKIPAGV